MLSDGEVRQAEALVRLPIVFGLIFIKLLRVWIFCTFKHYVDVLGVAWKYKDSFRVHMGALNYPI